jgi:3-isopropylmalate/(R)-2-methylmalate dehydratase large subunit
MSNPSGAVRGLTVAEKIISAHAGRAVRAGELVIARIDGVMATDATGPLAIVAFREMGGKRVWDPAKVSLILDHAAPAPNERVSTRERAPPANKPPPADLSPAHGRERACAPGRPLHGADSTPTYGALKPRVRGRRLIAGALPTGRLSSRNHRINWSAACHRV